MELAQKQYPENYQIQTPDFVLMFIPVDYALTLALQADPTLYEYACRRNIYLVSPSTLIPTLRVVSDLWIYAQQEEHVLALSHAAEQIFQQAERMSDSFLEILKQTHRLSRMLHNFHNETFIEPHSLYRMLENFALDRLQPNQAWDSLFKQPQPQTSAQPHSQPQPQSQGKTQTEPKTQTQPQTQPQTQELALSQAHTHSQPHTPAQSQALAQAHAPAQAQAQVQRAQPRIQAHTPAQTISAARTQSQFQSQVKAHSQVQSKAKIQAKDQAQHPVSVPNMRSPQATGSGTVSGAVSGFAQNSPYSPSRSSTIPFATPNFAPSTLASVLSKHPLPAALAPVSVSAPALIPAPIPNGAIDSSSSAANSTSAPAPSCHMSNPLPNNSARTYPAPGALMHPPAQDNLMYSQVQSPHAPIIPLGSSPKMQGQPSTAVSVSFQGQPLSRVSVVSVQAHPQGYYLQTQPY